MENFIKKLYKNFLYGRITNDEFLEMRHAINHSDKYDLMEMMEEEWNEPIESISMRSENKKRIKNELNHFIEQENRKKTISLKKILWVAAVLLPFVVVSTYFFTSQFNEKIEEDFFVSVEPGNKATVVLPDQTRVWMNSNSSLQYSRKDKNIRSVQLIGEAFFKVKHDENHPFVVSNHGLNIKVLGTSFNVKARKNFDIVEVTLIEGKVKLEGESFAQDYYLKPNEKATYNVDESSIEIHSTDTKNETAWIDNKMVFKSEKVKHVLTMIEDWYGVKIENYCPEIEDDLLSGSLKNENLETVLDILKMQYKVKYKKNNDSIIIYN